MAFYDWNNLEFYDQNGIAKFTQYKIKNDIYTLAEFSKLVEIPRKAVCNALHRSKHDIDAFILILKDMLYREAYGLSFRATVYRHNGLALHVALIREVTGLSEYGAGRRLAQWIKGTRSLSALFDPPKSDGGPRNTFGTCRVTTPRKSIDEVSVGSWEAERLAKAKSFAPKGENMGSCKMIPDIPVNDTGAFIGCSTKA
jgi:hypothetical protein